MSQRAAGERVRWLSALLILTAITGTSAIVRFWPTGGPAPLLASRPIYLYVAPVAPSATMAALSTSQVAPERHPQARAVVSTSTPVPSEVLDAAAPIPEPIAAAEVLNGDPPVAPPAPVSEPVAIADPSATDLTPVSAQTESAARVESAALAEAAPPVPSTPRGLVELPAVAVTRAVTVAGRGIMTGLRATGAMFRAAF